MSSIIISGDTSGTATIQAPSVAGTPTLTLPTTSGTIALTSQLPVAGPAFSAYQTSGVSLSSGVYSKVLFQAEEFDTANCYDTSTSKFTPNVAGYYQFNYVLNVSGGTVYRTQLAIYKNGSKVKAVRDASATAGDIENGSVLIYANGSTDYFEFYAYCGGAGATWPGIADTYAQGFLARAA
jgi:hypothetical protein